MRSWSEYYQSADADIGKFVAELGVHRKMIESVVEVHPQRTLEVGCGTSRFSIFLSYLGMKVVAADSDPGIVKKASSLCEVLNGNVEYLQADTFSLPFADSSFDVCFHQGLMEHFSDEDIRKIIAEQLRVAKRVVFSVPNKNYPYRDFGNERLMSRKEWKRILSPFNLVQASYYYRIKPESLLKKLRGSRHTMYLAVLERQAQL